MTSDSSVRKQSRTLIIGATGMVGGFTLNELRAAGSSMVAFVRNVRRAAKVLGPEIPLVEGDLGDLSSLRSALTGIDSVLLLSRHEPSMRQLQLGAVEAIAGSSVTRVVKLSGSPVSVRADSPAELGRDHHAVEAALWALPIEFTAIRPSIFMQTFFEMSDVVARGALPGPDGEPRLSFSDARDVGRVAAALLTTDVLRESVVEVTGPEALTWGDVADAMTATFGRSVTHYPAPLELVRTGLIAQGRSEWFADRMVELADLARQPKAAEVTESVRRLTGRAPTSIRSFLEEHKDLFPGAPAKPG